MNAENITVNNGQSIPVIADRMVGSINPAALRCTRFQLYCKSFFRFPWLELRVQNEKGGQFV